MTLLEAALRYAQQGWAVHPLVPHSKAPLSAHGCKDATTDADQIRAWWAEHPGANIGIATGAISGIVVLDVDVKNGKPGNQTLAALVAQHGELPTTPHQTTWSGGLQYFFEYDARVKNTAGALGAGLDTRGDGGYVVAPPSRVEEAGRSGVYVWDDLMNPFALPLYAKIPEWLIPSNWERVNGKTRETIPQLAGKGRNNALTSLAGTMRRRDVSEDAVRQALLAENATFSKPLGVEEVEKIVQSAMRNFGAADDITQDAGGERFTDMANAARLADEAAGRIAHADEMKGQRWFVHDGTRLVDEPKTAVIPFVRDVAQRLFAEATALQDEIARRETAVRADAGNLTANAGNAADQAIEELERRAEMKVQGAKRLESSMTLKVGVKVKNSAYISRAVTGSCPVICLMSASAICWPCSASVADTNRAPRRTAMSFRLSSPYFFTIRVVACVEAA